MFRLMVQEGPSAKRAYWLLACGIAVGLPAAWAPAQARTIAVDFSVLPTTIDITTPNNVTLNGVTFTFDNFGTNAVASADQVGIFGIVPTPMVDDGVLDLKFSGTVAAMSFVYQNFDNTGVVTPVPDALTAIFSNGGVFTDAVLESGNLNEPATFIYSGPTFDQADFFFSTSATVFTADTFVYQEPEPMSLALLGIGLAGLAVVRRKRA